MHTYTQIYQFASSVGALEGYVYKKPGPAALDLPALTSWIDNICKAYEHLPAEVRDKFQADLDRTLGRALHSLKAALGEKDERVGRLQALIQGGGRMPVSADDFNKRKWFD